VSGIEDLHPSARRVAEALRERGVTGPFLEPRRLSVLDLFGPFAAYRYFTTKALIAAFSCGENGKFFVKSEPVRLASTLSS
jgi:hypothetical protein